MSAVAAAIGATAVIGGSLIAGGAAKSAANTQAQAARDAAAQQQAMFEKQVALQEPFRQAGISAQNQLLNYMGLGGDTTAAGYGKYTKDFGMADYTADPGYQFRLAEGQKALERSAAARGLLSSGSTLKGIENYAQGAASQEYQNAFNRYQTNRANQLNPLQSLMGAGQTSANTLTNAAGVQGQNQANTTMAAGQARASGYVGAGNALSGALGSIGNSALQYGVNNYGGGLGGFNYGLNNANTASAVNSLGSYVSPSMSSIYGAGGSAYDTPWKTGS